MSRRKKRIRFIAYNIVVVLVILCGIEWYLTAQLDDPANAPAWMAKGLRKYYHEYDCTIIQMHPEMARYDSGLFYTLKPGEFTFSNREFSTDFQVNSMGLRDDEASLQAPRMMVLGDSYSMGWGVNQNETYASLLEEELEMKVLNTAISSYGTAREFSMLNRLDTDSLEYLILQYCPNDLYENQRFAYAENELHVSSQEKYQRQSDFEQERKGYFFFKHLVTMPGYLKGEDENKALEQKRRDAARRASEQERGYEERGIQPTPLIDSSVLIGGIEAFLSVLRSSENLPASTKIIVFSLEAQKCDASFINALRPKVDEQYATSLHDRISYLDLTGLLDSSHRYVLDPHLNPTGHRIIANALKEHLAQLNLSPQQKVWTYDNGDTSIVAHYDNGVKEGLFTAYWPNGHIAMTEWYTRGEKTGWTVNYDTTGLPVDSVKTNWP